MVAKGKGADHLDLNKYRSPKKDQFETSLGGVVVRDADGVHFCDEGSVITSTWVVDQINRLRLLPKPTRVTTAVPTTTTTTTAAATRKQPTTTAAPTR